MQVVEGYNSIETFTLQHRSTSLFQINLPNLTGKPCICQLRFHTGQCDFIVICKVDRNLMPGQIYSIATRTTGKIQHAIGHGQVLK